MTGLPDRGDRIADFERAERDPACQHHPGAVVRLPARSPGRRTMGVIDPRAERTRRRDADIIVSELFLWLEGDRCGSYHCGNISMIGTYAADPIAEVRAWDAIEEAARHARIKAYREVESTSDPAAMGALEAFTRDAWTHADTDRMVAELERRGFTVTAPEP